MKDYGCDPMGNGTFKMIPSGDIVNKTKRDNRLPLKNKPDDSCFGMSWNQIETMQGGKLKRDMTL